MSQTLSTADLPESMALAEATTTPVPAPKSINVLTCTHGPACPACVTAAMRALIDQDATLEQRVYTG